MTKITFLIGNGFDINVGLDTRYKDFYEYYVKEYPGDKLAREIGADYEYWADLEEGLGKYTSKLSPEEYEAFWESENRLEEALADYLESQMERVDLEKEDKKKEIAKIMQSSLNRFYMELPKEQQQRITNIIYNTRESILFSFISFNYTSVFDSCVKVAKELTTKGFGSHNASNGISYDHSLGDVLHIHGTTAEEMVVGVNDVSQIANKEFAKKPLYCQWLIKEATNKRFSQNKINDMRNIIDGSIIICIFGMSIGKTDNMWWQYICKWLMGNKLRRVIIYVKRNEGIVKRVTKRVMFLSQDEIFEKVKINSGLKDTEWNAIESQIFIKFDTSIFRFTLV